MTDQEALCFAQSWIARRKEVRKHLINMAREANPVPAGAYFQHVSATHGDELRKLYKFPSDLREVRLLELIENPIVPKPAPLAKG